jgi:hypothetical protein
MCNANGVGRDQLILDAAASGSLCVRAAQQGLRVGVTRDGFDLSQDYTGVLNGPGSEVSREVTTVPVPRGVYEIIEATGRSPERIIYDGMILMATSLSRRIPRSHLVIAQVRWDVGQPMVVNCGEAMPVPYSRNYVSP